MRKLARFAPVAILASALSLSACTARYSQSLVGSMAAAQNGQPVNSRGTGLSILSIALVEPISAYDQVSNLLRSCKELSRVEVDYRDLYFFVFSIPSVRVVGDCVQ